MKISVLMLRAILLTALGCFPAVESKAFSARGDIRQGGKLYEDGKHEEAVERYDRVIEADPDNVVALYNKASALYRMGRFKEAKNEFLKVLASKEEGPEGKAIYNAGNSRYRAAEVVERAQGQDPLRGYKEALEYYLKAMQLTPEDMDAKYNYEFTLKKINELKEQQQEDQQDQQDEQDRQDQQDRQNEQDQQDEQDRQDQQDEQDRQDRQDEQDRQDRQDEQDQQDRQDRQDEQDQQDRQDEQDRQDQQDQQDQQDGKEQPEREEDRSSEGSPRDYREEPLPGEMTREMAESLLQSQEEEERRMRAEEGKKKRGGGAAVLRDW